jgi:hypothetical protein
MTPAERTELEDLATGWRTRAEVGKGLVYPGQDLYGCADEIERFITRHAPTDPAPPPPPSTRETQATIPDGAT